MIKLNVGCNFDPALVDNVVRLNEKYKSNNIKVEEFYGSAKKDMVRIKLPTARPDYRLPNTSFDSIKQFISVIHKFGFKFNYTLNSPLTSDWFDKSDYWWNDLIKFIKELGVDIVTVSHPIAIARLWQHFPLEISTILDVNDINAIKIYLHRYNFPISIAVPKSEQKTGIKKFCTSLAKNRDYGFLTGLYRTGLSDKVELLANEFCSVEGTPCQSFYRKSCYEVHALGGNRDKADDGYPMKLCSASRFTAPDAWIKANVIYPWDLRLYQDSFGINQFKISGRTMPTKYIVQSLQNYMSLGRDMADDNLLSLWGHVDKSDRSDEHKMKIPNIEISMAKLMQRSLVADIFNRQIEMRTSCANMECSICKICSNAFEACKIE